MSQLNSFDFTFAEMRLQCYWLTFAFTASQGAAWTNTCLVYVRIKGGLKVSHFKTKWISAITGEKVKFL